MPRCRLLAAAIAILMTAGTLFATSFQAVALPHGTPGHGRPAKVTKEDDGQGRPLATVPLTRLAPVPSGDEVVTGRGDSAGWHLYAASSGDGWRWQPLATLFPAGGDPNGERWIGRQCLTGDGRFVVAVVAPWSANNSAAGLNAGGIAYVVDAHSGRVRPLVGGLSLAYFTPSCGPGDAVALTRFSGADEQATILVRASAARAAVTQVIRVRGQYTSAVPAPDDGFLAVRGETIVALTRRGSRLLARVPGLPFDLTANSAGGADFLVGRAKTATIWRLADGRAAQVGTGSFYDLALFPGRAGHTLAAGTTRLNPAAGIRPLPAADGPVEAVSLDGGGRAIEPVVSLARAGAAVGPAALPAALPAVPAALPAVPAALPAVPAAGVIPMRLVAAGRAPASWTPTTAAAPVTALPRMLRDDGTLSPADASSSTACAVPRNNVYLQAMQPYPDQVDWAANLAGRGLLTGNASRPAGYANLGLPGYSPSTDFPLPAPFGPGGEAIPREVLEGIFAQESNFNQASWHSVGGLAGNPLIADYYGAAGGTVAGVATPDCGYGIGQVTTGMTVGAMSYDLQRKVAVDYEENAAAAAQILAQKWNELAAAGITANGADPTRLESWYFAIWDYNSGLHPDSGSGPWGLGWTNNPANPDYPYNRHPFLHQDFTSEVVQVTYDDASHPGDWPYQEKVFGWMEVPLINSHTGLFSYDGLIGYPDTTTNTNQIASDYVELSRPAVNAFCDPQLDDCDPAICSRSMYGSNCDPSTTDGAGPCLRSDYECWWHYAYNWCSQYLHCVGNSWEYNAGDAEPGMAWDDDPLPVCDVDTGAVPAGSIVVDSQPAGVNLQGCSMASANWHNEGDFTFSYGDPANPGSQQTDMDVHQLGAGLAGHLWFTHTNEPTDSNGVSLWGVTGTWAPDLIDSRYEVKVFVPAAAATTTQATYTISNGRGLSHQVTISQADYTDAWVSLGTWWLGPGASVSLTNLNTTADGDLAFSGVAFVPQPSGTYVMLGDSYSSGEGTLSYDSGTDNYPALCWDPATNDFDVPCTNNGHRSSLSYNRVFADATRVFGPNGNRVDVACSGAIIDDFFNDYRSDGKCPNELRQASALGSDTSLVTLTFGGNDLDFAPVIKACVLRQGCQNTYDDSIRAQIAALMNPANPRGWPSLFAAIRQAAPNAEIVVLGYPEHLVQSAADQPGNACWQAGFMDASDRDWLNQMGELLEQDLSQTAAASGVDFIDVAPMFLGHELCTSDPWFTGIFDGSANDDLSAMQNLINTDPFWHNQNDFHPNSLGYCNEAQLLASEIPVPIANPIEC
jgi:hypothetical protein